MARGKVDSSIEKAKIQGAFAVSALLWSRISWSVRKI